MRNRTNVKRARMRAAARGALTLGFAFLLLSLPAPGVQARHLGDCPYDGDVFAIDAVCVYQCSGLVAPWGETLLKVCWISSNRCAETRQRLGIPDRIVIARDEDGDRGVEFCRPHKSSNCPAAGPRTIVLCEVW